MTQRPDACFTEIVWLIQGTSKCSLRLQLQKQMKQPAKKYDAWRTSAASVAVGGGPGKRVCTVCVAVRSPSRACKLSVALSTRTAGVAMRSGRLLKNAVFHSLRSWEGGSSGLRLDEGGSGYRPSGNGSRLLKSLFNNLPRVVRPHTTRGRRLVARQTANDRRRQNPHPSTGAR